MGDHWLCLIQGEQIGPLSFARLQQLAEAGRLKPHDYVRPENQEEWSFATDVPNLLPTTAVTQDAAEAPRRRADAAAPPKRRDSGTIPRGQAVSPASVAPARAAAPPPKRIPAGRAVAASPAANIPTGQALAPPVRSPQASESSPSLFIVTDTNANGTGSSVTRGRPHHKTKGGISPLLLGGGIVAGLLGIIVVLMLSGVIDLTSSEPVARNKATKEETAKEPIEPSEDANPTEDADAAKSEKGEKNATAASDRALLKGISKWSDASRIKSVTLHKLTLAVTGVWLSASETGEPYLGGDAVEKPKFLVVKLNVENGPGAAPLNFAGWSHSAVLFNAEDQSIRPIAVKPGVKETLEAGESHLDTLIFPLASVEFEKLRLVLPHETVGIPDSKSFALELPRHVVGKGLEASVATTTPVNGRIVGSETGDSQIIAPPPVLKTAPEEEAMPTTTPPVIAATPPKKDDDDINSLLDALKAKAEERDKMEKK